MPVTLASELTAAFFAFLFGFGAGLSVHGLFVLRILFGVDAGGAIPARLAAFHFPYIPQKADAGKKRHSARGVLLFFFDFFFALGVGLAFLLFLYARHDGVFRLFLLVAAVLGATLYFFTLGRLVARVLATASYLLHVLLLYLGLILLLPVRLLFCTLFFCSRVIFYRVLLCLSFLCAPLITRVALQRAKGEGRAYILHCVKNS